jgi:hypothetical protein
MGDPSFLHRSPEDGDLLILTVDTLEGHDITS